MPPCLGTLHSYLIIHSNLKCYLKIIIVFIQNEYCVFDPQEWKRKKKEKRSGL
jgi:hypothetical protein